MKLETLIAIIDGLLFVMMAGFACERAPRIYSVDELLAAIERVESGCDANAVGDGGEAVGSFQIHKCFVDEVNRISGWPRFSYEDRKSSERSRAMARLYLAEYGGSIEQMARKFNGGPEGHKKRSTLKYWKKVKAELSKV